MSRIPHRAILLFLGILLLLPNCTFQVDASDYVEACSAGYERCSQKEIQRCNDQGTGFIVLEMCSDDEVCRDLTCVANIQEEITTSQNAGGETNGVTGPQPSTRSNANGGSSSNNSENTSPPPYVFDGTIIKVKFQIEESLEEGMIDIGLCGGTPTTGAIPTFCSPGLFLRVENVAGQLLGMLYHAKESEDPQPVEGSAVNLTEGEIYDLLYLRQTGFEEQGEVPLTVTFDGSSFGSTFQLGVTTPAEVFTSFGLWNYRTDGGTEHALSGAVVGLEISQGEKVELYLPDFLELTDTTEFEWDINQRTKIAYFYVTNGEQNSALFPLSVIGSQ